MPFKISSGKIWSDSEAVNSGSKRNIRKKNKFFLSVMRQHHNDYNRFARFAHKHKFQRAQPPRSDRKWCCGFTADNRREEESGYAKSLCFIYVNGELRLARGCIICYNKKDIKNIADERRGCQDKINSYEDGEVGEVLDKEDDKSQDDKSQDDKSQGRELEQKEKLPIKSRKKLRALALLEAFS